MSIKQCSEIHLIGSVARRQEVTRARLTLALWLVLTGFAVITIKLITLALMIPDVRIEGQERDAIQSSRPTLTDRNGIPMALDLRVPSIFAEPRRIVDIEGTVQGLTSVLTDLDADILRQRLASGRGFVWVKREVTPSIRDAIMKQGLPGIDFLIESRRFYPAGPEAAHVLGTVDIDNRGIAGIEKTLDRDSLSVLQSVGLARGQSLTPVALSIDMRVQHVMREHLISAIHRFQAVAGAGVLLDVATGEVLALVSLPDFNPNFPATSLSSGSLNRITGGAYELGSTLKIITIAAALDGGSIGINDHIDARQGVRFGRFMLNHGKHRILSVAEVFKYSDNIGTIRIMQALGKDNFRTFLTRAGIDAPSSIELSEVALPRVPKSFSDVQAATASYGYGLATTPLNMASAIAALANEGKSVPPTLFPRTLADAAALYQSIASPQTSAEVLYLMRLNAVEGSGRRAEAWADGFGVGGKTGTAEKVVGGQYSDYLNLTVFTAVFPVQAPRFTVLVMLDEAKAETPSGSREAGWNVAEVAGQIIQRVAPMLGVEPDTSSLR